MSIKIVKDEKSVACLYDMDFPLPPEMYEKISSFLWDKVCTTCERVVTFKKKKSNTNTNICQSNTNICQSNTNICQYLSI